MGVVCVGVIFNIVGCVSRISKQRTPFSDCADKESGIDH